MSVLLANISALLLFSVVVSYRQMNDCLAKAQCSTHNNKTTCVCVWWGVFYQVSFSYTATLLSPSTSALLYLPISLFLLDCYDSQMNQLAGLTVCTNNEKSHVEWLSNPNFISFGELTSQRVGLLAKCLVTVFIIQPQHISKLILHTMGCGRRMKLPRMA